MMEIILLERIAKLGQMGDRVKVKPGYARNYLIPQHKALRATPENTRFFEEKRVQLETENQKKRQESETLAETVKTAELILIRQAGDNDQLYGSVTARDIAKSLAEIGVPVKSNQVRLDRSIKLLGLHPCRVALHAEVIVDIVLNVARSHDEAMAQKKAAAEAGDKTKDPQEPSTPPLSQAQAQTDDIPDSGPDAEAPLINDAPADTGDSPTPAD